MSEILNRYFERFADESIQRMKAAVLAVNYYERIRMRLAKKEDLSNELAIIGTLGPKVTMEVVKEAIADYKQQLANAWSLHPRLVEIGKFKCNYTLDQREHLPRANLTYEFKSAAGEVKIRITSAAETFKLEINAGKNPMVAQLACTELEKNLTFIALTS